MPKTRRRLAGDEQGFTLIELMVVVLIIAVLLAIAIPTFLGARERSQVRAAQSNVRLALSAAHVYFAQHQTFSTSTTQEDAAPTISALPAIEPSLTYQAGALTNTAPTVVRVRVNDTVGTVVRNGIICVGVLGRDGQTYTIRSVSTGDNPGIAYRYGPGAQCRADQQVGTAGWRAAW